jgi:hypothetical protein
MQLVRSSQCHDTKDLILKIQDCQQVLTTADGYFSSQEFLQLEMTKEFEEEARTIDKRMDRLTYSCAIGTILTCHQNLANPNSQLAFLLQQNLTTLD